MASSSQHQADQFLNPDLKNSLPPPSTNPSPVLGADQQDDQAAGAVQQILKQSAHPTVAIFHVAFKLAAIASYLMLGLFTKNFVIQFVLSTTMLAFDFWTVKNVTGRLLVGLRWWHEAAEEGISTQWRFETIPQRDNLNLIDARIFWWSLYITPLIWFGLGLICVLKFNISYLLIVLIALVLSAANIVGYYKCNKDATDKIRSYISKTVLGHALEQSGMGGLSAYV